MPSEISCEMRERAYGICRDYLHGAWKQISPHDMVIKQICGGLSNLLYYCALPTTHPPKALEPSEVLLRIYGRVHGEDALESLLAESVIFALLSERNLGPKLYGVFPGGRLEQFIPARSLLTAELRDREITNSIAKKMANIHALNVPISKEPTWLWNTLERWWKSSQEYLTKNPEMEGVPKNLFERVKKFNYRKEMDYLKKVAAKVQSPVVFSHNDLQEGNILLNSQGKTIDEKISIIDFEYCSYNHRGFDIANHFNEWMYEYKLPVNPYYTVAMENYPDKDKQLFFIRAYLEAYELAKRRKGTPSSKNSDESEVSVAVSPHTVSRHSSPFTDDIWSTCLPPIQWLCNSSGSTILSNVPVSCNNMVVPSVNASSPSHPTEEKILAEVQVFSLATHLFWSLWSIVQVQVSTIPFGYWEFASLRLDQYTEEKARLRTDSFIKRKSDAISTDS